MKSFTAVLLALLFCIGCDKKQTGQAAAPPIPSVKLEFNVTDKSIDSNGNVAVAFNKYIQMANGAPGPVAEKMQVSTLTKSPYSYLGKLIQVKGRIFKIEELPPDPRLPGRMSEVLMLTSNSNSPLGATTVDCLCIGDTSKMNSGQDVICGGYFIGTYDSPNAMGGKVEALAIVGNIIQGK